MSAILEHLQSWGYQKTCEDRDGPLLQLLFEAGDGHVPSEADVKKWVESAIRQDPSFVYLGQKVTLLELVYLDITTPRSRFPDHVGDFALVFTVEEWYKKGEDLTSVSFLRGCGPSTTNNGKTDQPPAKVVSLFSRS
ncbi:MAG: hypothetical protein HOC36_03415 [Candidatus Magasanikbacteria bacterium]|jgi:hypothetical protein|nr:hypothetical protein [Candidatus Magasanikbacteria bacterium]MBT4547363.1 hypothetical protein [Candidatus Magasanikbacteria bacterium]